MEKFFRELIAAIGEDVQREGLRDTPARAAKAFAFLTKGYQQRLEDILGNAIYPSDTNEMVIVKDIELYSLCEHHLLPFIGKCHVGYLPQGKVLGLSKIARIVNLFARRLQMQEVLTQEIAEALMHSVNAIGVGVIIEAKHLCMMMRGVEKQRVIMKTSCMLGCFRNNGNTRAEFLNLIRS